VSSRQKDGIGHLLAFYVSDSAILVSEKQSWIMLLHDGAKNEPLTVGKGDTTLLPVTSANADRFSKFFHYRTRQ